MGRLAFGTCTRSNYPANVTAGHTSRHPPPNLVSPVVTHATPYHTSHLTLAQLTSSQLTTSSKSRYRRLNSPFPSHPSRSVIFPTTHDDRPIRLPPRIPLSALLHPSNKPHNPPRPTHQMGRPDPVLLPAPPHPQALPLLSRALLYPSDLLRRPRPTNRNPLLQCQDQPPPLDGRHQGSHRLHAQAGHGRARRRRWRRRLDSLEAARGVGCERRALGRRHGAARHGPDRL